MAENRARAVWRMRLGSAFRTAVACTIVGCTNHYGPSILRSQVPFEAFSYLTTVLIVSDATLGDTLRGCWHAFYATVLVVPTSVFSLWIIGPGRFSACVAALAVALGAFLVALPESTDLLSKRIAFGQIVIVYVGAVIHGEETGVVIHPIHVASSTALGALASILALLLPYPRLACCEVRKLCPLYATNASERISLFVKAFSGQHNPTAIEAIHQAKPFAETGAKLLQSIKEMQEGALWEKFRIRLSKPNKPGDRLQDMEQLVRGMEIALTSCPTFPVRITNQKLGDLLEKMEAQINLKLEQPNCFLPLNATTAPEMKVELLDKFLQPLKTLFPTHKDLPTYFFLYCIKLLQDDSNVTQNTESNLDNSHKPNIEESRYTQEQAKYNSFTSICNSWCTRPRNEALVFAFKCSLSLGLAVLFGLLFSQENGYWSGLTIAISFAAGGQATFTFANARAQGTAIGSVYGVLGCFVFQKINEIRFLPLLPWMIFTSFLRHSRMYGQAGGISAVMGALLILGRQNYGPPDEFAIARLTEAFIGLFCFIMVELFLQPIRAATLAKGQLSRSLGTLQECIGEIVLNFSQKDMPTLIFPALREKKKKLKTQVEELEKFTRLADLEPNFWFLPFRVACYRKLLGSFSRMVDLLHFMAYRMEFLLKASQKCQLDWRELQEYMNSDLELFKKNVGSSLKGLEKITSVKSFAVFEEEVQKKKPCHDLEWGKSSDENVCILSTFEEEVEKTLSSFLQHLREVTNKIKVKEGDDEYKSQIVLCLSALGFCIGALMRETREIEKGIKELIQWENPTRCINFHEISCKIVTL